VPLPDFGRGTVTGMGSWQWGITVNTADGDAAWRFLQFLLQDEQVRQMSNANGAIPARASVARSSKSFGPGGDEHLYLQQLEAAPPGRAPDTGVSGHHHRLRDRCQGDLRRPARQAGARRGGAPRREGSEGVPGLSRARAVRRPMSVRDRPPLLARLRVGTKLMLLALLPVGLLVAVSVAVTIDAWRAADALRDFQAETRMSFAAGDLAGALSDERAATVLARLRPGSAADAAVGAAQRRTDVALRRAAGRAASASSHVDVAGGLAAIRRQLQAPRLQAAAGAIGEAAVADSYGLIVRDVLDLVRALDSGRRRPTASVRNPADAYVAMLAAIEPAERERLDVAALLSRRRDRAAGRASRWAPLEAARLDDFRASASSRLTTDLAASLFTPAGTQVTDVRSTLLASRVADRPGDDAGRMARRVALPHRGPAAHRRRGARRAGARGRARPRRGSRATESRPRRLAGRAGRGRCAGAGAAAVDHPTARRGVRQRTGAVRR
jgi:hypothetical protein